MDAFLEDVGQRPDGDYVLARIDTKKDYRPSNVHWITKPECNDRTGKGRLLNYKGRKMNIPAWARELGITQQALRQRLKVMSVAEALSRSAREQRKS